MIALTRCNPKWIGLLRPNSGEGLTFDCPTCGPGHKLAIYFSNPVDGNSAASWQDPTWKREGETFDSLTVEPSIQYPCFHGWIEDGKIIDINESTTRTMILVNGVLKVVALSPKQATGINK